MDGYQYVVNNIMPPPKAWGVESENPPVKDLSIKQLQEIYQLWLTKTVTPLQKKWLDEVKAELRKKTRSRQARTRINNEKKRKK